MTNDIQLPVRVVFSYKSCAGYNTEVLFARTEKEAEALFWRLHDRDLCFITNLSVTDYEQRYKRPDNCPSEGGKCPYSHLAQNLCPESPRTRRKAISSREFERMLRASRFIGDPGHFEIDLSKCDAALLVGEKDKVEAVKVSKHRQLVKGCNLVLPLNSGDQIAVLSGVPGDSGEEHDEVRGN